MDNKKFMRKLKKRNHEIFEVKELKTLEEAPLENTENIIGISKQMHKKLHVSNSVAYFLYTKENNQLEEKHDLNSEYNKDLKSKIEDMKGNLFQHYRNKRVYKVVDYVFNTFFDEYEILYVEKGKKTKYTRAYDYFMEKVTNDNGELVDRFVKIKK
jgi:hypothetical protein